MGRTNFGLPGLPSISIIVLITALLNVSDSCWKCAPGNCARYSANVRTLLNVNQTGNFTFYSHMNDF